MTREEAKKILQALKFIVDFENYSDRVEIAIGMAIEALKEQRPQGNWEYIKEHITEMRDADGELNQKQTCQFILNLMGVIEKEGDRNDS